MLPFGVPESSWLDRWRAALKPNQLSEVRAGGFRSFWAQRAAATAQPLFACKQVSRVNDAKRTYEDRNKEAKQLYRANPPTHGKVA